MGLGPPVFVRKRYQSALDLRSDLETLRREVASGASIERRVPLVGATPERKSIAVLPLHNVSGDRAQDFFCDGMTEALITELAKIRALRVISRTSVMRFQNTSLPLSEIAQELDVGAIVEGSVLKAGKRVRITALLIDAATDDHLWAEGYERDLKDILGIQSEVAEAIAHQIEVTLTPQDQARLAQRRQVDPEAHESYLKGRFHWNQRSVTSMVRGVDYFTEAIEKDPTYASAYVGLADSYNLLGYYSDRPPNEVYPKAKAAASKAVEIDDSIAEAHASFGYSQLFYDWDWDAAEESFKKSIELNPAYASAHQWYGWHHTVMERFDDAIEAMRRARLEDPLSLIINDHLGLCLALAGRHDDAIEQLRETQSLNPAYALAHQRLGSVYLRLGDLDKAIEEYRQAVEKSDGRVAVGRLGLAYGRSGREEEALGVLARLNDDAAHRYLSPLEVALVHTGLDHTDRAFESLERAYEDRTSDLVRFNLYPWSDAMRSDPRFAHLKERIGLNVAVGDVS